MPNVIYVRLVAENDTNGNPRRCYLVLCTETGSALEVIDEGYSGRRGVSNSYPEAKQGPDIKVPVKEYRSWLAWQLERSHQHTTQTTKANGLLGSLLRQARLAALGLDTGDIDKTIRELALHMAEGKEAPDWKSVLTMHMNALATEKDPETS